MNQRCRLRHYRNLLQFSVILPFFGGRILASGDLIEGAPFRFDPQVGVPREQGARDGAG